MRHTSNRSDRVRPRIGVSAAFVKAGRVGGAEQALYGYVEGLAEAARPTHDVVVYTMNPLPAGSLPPGVGIREISGLFRNRFLWETFDLPRHAGDLDGLLFTNYFTPPTAYAGRRVTVINDLQYLHIPENFSRRKRAWLRLSHLGSLTRADAVIAISNFVRDDILNQYGQRFASKVHVIPTPIRWAHLDQAGRPPAALTQWNGAPFILSVSANWPHKNTQTLIRAFARIQAKRPNLTLVLVGQTSANLPGMVHAGQTVESLIDSLGVRGRVLMTGYVEEAELAWLYRHARFFVFPSTFEGHGRPATEAIGLGLPVIATRRTAVPEATGELASYVRDPFDADELADAILRVNEAPQKYKPDSRSVVALRDRFSPTTTGRQLFSVIRGHGV